MLYVANMQTKLWANDLPVAEQYLKCVICFKIKIFIKIERYIHVSKSDSFFHRFENFFMMPELISNLHLYSKHTSSMLSTFFLLLN